MKKLTLTTALSALFIASISNAQQVTCYENHYNSVPIEIRKQQAQSIDQVTTATIVSMGVIVTGSGIAGFTLVKKAYPAQDTVTNLSTAGTAVAGSVVVAGITGEIIISSTTSEFNELMKIRNLSDEAVTGGKTLDSMAEKLTRALNDINTKTKNSRNYDKDLIKLSMSQILIDSAELCQFKDSSEVMTNIWNATLQRYHKLSER
jgi:Rieske Fe-S protein